MEGLLEAGVLDGTIDGAMNFRDLGGIAVEGGRVRTGHVYRSAMTHHISPEGLASLADTYAIRTVIDLRNDTELQNFGIAEFGSVGIAHRHLPVATDASLSDEERAERMRWLSEGEPIPAVWAEMYLRMARESHQTFRELFAVLADDESFALVFHCSGGRDRTGVAAALLLGSLGASDPAIAADYARTGPLLEPHGARFEPIAALSGIGPEQLARITVATEAASMLAFLPMLREEYGSVDAYLNAIGVMPDEIERIRARLVEPENGA